VSKVLYFTATWCNPCERTKPVAEELLNEGIIDFEFIDVDNNLDLVKQFKILSVPTFILVDNEQEIKRMNGAKTREQFLDFVDYKEDTHG
jgi:thioredoxin 1